MPSITKLAALAAAVSLAVPSLAAASLAPASAPTPGAKPAAAPAAHAAAKPAAPSDKAQLEALEKRFIAAFQAKDVTRVMANYAKDGLFVFDVSPPRDYAGWAAYKKDWEELFAAFPGPLKVSISDLSITAVGTVGYSHSIQAAQFTTKDGSKFDVVVRVTDVYRKIGGKWKIVLEHVSVPVDLATGKADLLSKY
jgi:ketosteroid isomerase-like protein